jgi:hypothetical protein
MKITDKPIIAFLSAVMGAFLAGIGALTWLDNRVDTAVSKAKLGNHLESGLFSFVSTGSDPKWVNLSTLPLLSALPLEKTARSADFPIGFDHPFLQAPKVCSGIFDFNLKSYVEKDPNGVKPDVALLKTMVWAQNPSHLEQFYMHVQVWDRTALESITVTWFAYEPQ